jgi:murein DD-endopeptidase MepM/ murein hydrolase activator NlpD
LLRSALSRASGTVSELHQLAAAVGRVIATPDGRWTLVSSSLTASVAVSMTWLALAAEPASLAHANVTAQNSASYNSFMRVAGLGSGRGEPLMAAGLIAPPNLAGPVDRLLEGEKTLRPKVETRILTVANGDTIVGMLQEAGVPAKDANAVVDAMKPLYSPRSIRTGQTFQATFGKPDAKARQSSPEAADEDDSVAARTRRLLSLSFSPSVEHQITVRLSVPDGYMAQDVQRKLQGRYQHAGGTIDSSLYLAAAQAGIPANIVVELIRMFSYDVDFQRDVHPGDSFEVFYNHLFTPEGQPARPGEILQATMTLSGRKRTLYRFDGCDDVEYFDASGRSAKSMLMKTPVDGARISSTFGQREHPVLGFTRMHKGIDFAVPRGTPVMAAGSGTISYAGTANGFGNLLVINHANGYSTAYAHLSRFGAGMRQGTRVRQGEVVAFSGMTGLATGPHLHYEIRVHDSQVNPASVKVASGRALEGAEMVAFRSERSRIDGLVASLPVQKKLALVSGLRDTAE